MAEISGTVEDSGGAAIEGAVVYAIDSEGNALLGSDTTDVNGDYSIAVDQSTTAHAFVQYEDSNGQKYAAVSRPYLDVQADVYIVDDYEDQDLVEYTDYEEAGGTSDFTISSNQAIEGTYSLLINGHTDYPKILSTSGLNNYPQQGDEFEIWFYPDFTPGSGSADSGFYFGASDLSNHYWISYRGYQDEIRFHVNGNWIDGVSSPGVTANEWHKFVVQWDDGNSFGGSPGDFTIDLEDNSGNVLATITANDTTHEDGGFGFFGAAESTEYFYWDYPRITYYSPRTTWVDNFEDNDLSEYGGNTGSYTTQGTTVYEGNYALEASSTGIITSDPGDGLANYPSRGDTFQFMVRASQTTSWPQVLWCMQDNGGDDTLEYGYYVALDNDDQNVNVWSYDGNYDRHIRVGIGTSQVDEWLRVYLEHHSDDSMYCEVERMSDNTVLGSGSGTPVNNYSSGDLKFRCRDGAPVYWDDFKIL